jgi:hypothetical protein
MDPGYFVDHTYGAMLPAAWVPGIPRKTRWRGFIIRKQDKVPVTTFRCVRCGRLQSYAWPA